MALSNSQYDQVMRRYSAAQSRQQRLLAQRQKRAYELIPALKELDHEVAQAAVDSLADTTGQPVDTAGRIRRVGERRAALLKEHDLPADYLSLQYDCPDCHDTGYLDDGRKCHCFRRAEIELFYTQSGLEDILKKENFDTFSFEYYPEDQTVPATGLSIRQTMQRYVQTCRHFIDSFDDPGLPAPDNLLFYGGTGLGKTFLSHCIARELIDRSHSVLYLSAQDLFRRMETAHFGDERGTDGSDWFLYEYELLIIDDLGTEMANSFTVSSLFRILNTRDMNRRRTIISTNLTLSSLAQKYSERIFSRIASGFHAMGFFGEDIRIQKAKKGLHHKA